MGAGFRLSDQGQEIIKALKDVLEASVALFDAEKQEYHLAMSSDWWFSHRGDIPDHDARGCRVKAPINDRWTLIVAPGFRERARRALGLLPPPDHRRPPWSLHPDAETIATWAARKLAVHLPRRAVDLGVPPAQGGGGTSGGAELGIPLWWARKHRI